MTETPEGRGGFGEMLPLLDLNEFSSRLATFLRLNADITNEQVVGMLDVSTALANGDPHEAVALFAAIAAHNSRLAVLNAQVADQAELLGAIIARNIPSG